VDTAPHQGWGNIVVADASAPSGDQLTITELFSGVSYNRSATTMRTTGAYLALSGSCCHVPHSVFGNVPQVSLLA